MLVFQNLSYNLSKYLKNSLSYEYFYLSGKNIRNLRLKIIVFKGIYGSLFKSEIIILGEKFEINCFKTLIIFLYIFSLFEGSNA